jgi:hypothetical protein
MKSVFTFSPGSNQLIGLVNKLLVAGIPFKVGPVSPVTDGVAINSKYHEQVAKFLPFTVYAPHVHGAKSYYSID